VGDHKNWNSLIRISKSLEFLSRLRDKF